MSLLGYLNLGRAAWPDLVRLVRPSDPAPDEVGTRQFWRLILDAARDGIKVRDPRGFDRMAHYDPRVWGYFRDDNPKRNIPKRGRAHGTLPWEKRTAIMLHRTGVRMGPYRFLGCPCHCAVADDGTIVLCHPNDAYVMHGHTANRFSVGVEISSADGSVTSLQVKAARLLVRYIAEDLRQHRGEGAPIVIMAHRQSHKSRPDDPGREIWQRVAVPMAAALDLKPGPTVGSGRPIPEGWW